jgi:aminoglycoside 6-adenylyltransferase
MQFIDGNRIDLGLVDVANISEINDENDIQPRRILLDKDGRTELYDVSVGDIYNIKPPTEQEYFDTCNEFW